MLLGVRDHMPSGHRRRTSRYRGSLMWRGRSKGLPRLGVTIRLRSLTRGHGVRWTMPYRKPVPSPLPTLRSARCF